MKKGGTNLSALSRGSSPGGTVPRNWRAARHSSPSHSRTSWRPAVCRRGASSGAEQRKILLTRRGQFCLFHNPSSSTSLWLSPLPLLLSLTASLSSWKRKSAPEVRGWSPLSSGAGELELLWSEAHRGAALEPEWTCLPAVGVGRFVFFPPVLRQPTPTKLRLAGSPR